MTETAPKLVNVHPLSDSPTIAWEGMKDNQKYVIVDPIPLDHPVSQDALRFVCISDTHTMTKNLGPQIPPGDVLIHAGDFTLEGNKDEVMKFNTFMGSLPHKHKIVIAGNHELTFDQAKYWNWKSTKNPNNEVSEMASLLTNCTYLQDSGIEIDGVSIYGAPWQPEYGGWAFNLRRGQSCLDKWNLIPDHTDVLITHGPPLGHGDYCKIGVRAGCVELLSTVQKRVKPKYHVFGHIHEGYGISTDEQTVFINASICTVSYRPINKPVIFDVPLPEGITKS